MARNGNFLYSSFLLFIFQSFDLIWYWFELFEKKTRIPPIFLCYIHEEITKNLFKKKNNLEIT